MSRVQFSQGGPAEIPDMDLKDAAQLEHEVAGHIVRRVRKLKKGKWFVQVAHDRAGGFIGFYGSEEKILFNLI